MPLQASLTPTGPFASSITLPRWNAATPERLSSVVTTSVTSEARDCVTGNSTGTGHGMANAAKQSGKISRRSSGIPPRRKNQAPVRSAAPAKSSAPVRRQSGSCQCSSVPSANARRPSAMADLHARFPVPGSVAPSRRLHAIPAVRNGTPKPNRYCSFVRHSAERWMNAHSHASAMAEGHASRWMRALTDFAFAPPRPSRPLRA